jgi:DNA topoisomerase-1
MQETPDGIRYVTDSFLSWSRQKHGSGFRYLDKDGQPLTDKKLDRIKKLAIPPAWTDVQICPTTNGHIQAIGFDAKGRKQYIYHPDWTSYNQQHKFDKLVQFGETLPTLRETIKGHMRQHSLTQERILATIVWLLENTFIRVGNQTYAKENQSYGLTTLRGKHVKVDGNTVNFSFKGKSGVYHQLDITHPRVAQTIKQCIELPGYELFQYLDDNQSLHTVDSQDVNDYLKTITGQEFSAKDFRTWGGTTLAGDSLYQIGNPESEKSAQQAIKQTVDQVAAHLGNTPSVCRTYYIHPTIVTSYQDSKLVPYFKRVYNSGRQVEGLSPEEFAAWSLIKK